jgi:SM-20-related protein
MFISNKITESLIKDGFSVTTDFLNQATCQGILAQLNDTHIRDEFHEAGIGKGDNVEVNQNIRGDKVYWLDNLKLLPFTQIFYDKLVVLQTCFNRSLYLGINAIEMHFAVYPVGKFYKKHIDTFKASSQRKITFILYLNENWQEEYGGHLRMYLKNNDIRDILPQLGTLVCFISAEIFHEVLPPTLSRKSLTGWMCRDDLYG